MIPRRTLARDGARFELRPYYADCAELLLEAALESRVHVAKWMSWLTANYGIEHARSWVGDAIRAWELDAAYEFVIYDREMGDVAGCAGLNAVNRKDQVCNLGYWVRASRLRMGAARLAAELLADFGFDVLGLNRMEIVVATGNLPSQRVAESVGACFEGIQGQRILVRHTGHDARMYALLRRDRRAAVARQARAGVSG